MNKTDKAIAALRAKEQQTTTIKTQIICPAQPIRAIDSDFKPILIGTVLDQNEKHSKTLNETIFGSATGLVVAILVHAVLNFLKK